MSDQKLKLERFDDHGIDATLKELFKKKHMAALLKNAPHGGYCGKEADHEVFFPLMVATLNDPALSPAPKIVRHPSDQGEHVTVLNDFGSFAVAFLIRRRPTAVHVFRWAHEASTGVIEFYSPKRVPLRLAPLVRCSLSALSMYRKGEPVDGIGFVELDANNEFTVGGAEP